MKQIKFTEFDEDVLDFTTVGDDPSLFLNVNNDKLNKRSLSIIEIQLQKAKLKSPVQISNNNIQNILIGQNAQKYDANDLDTGFDVFNLAKKPELEASTSDPFDQDFSKKQEQKLSKKVKQTSNHLLLRPRGASNCLDQHVVLLSGQNPYFTDEEFKKYISCLGGKVASSASVNFNVFIMGNNFNQSHLNIAQSKFAKRLTVEAFYNWIINKSISALIQSNQMKKRVQEELIGKYLNGMSWVGYDDCFQNVEIGEIVSFYKEQEEVDNLQQPQYMEDNLQQLKQLDEVQSTLQDILTQPEQKEINIIQPSPQPKFCKEHLQLKTSFNQKPMELSKIPVPKYLSDIFHSKVPIAQLLNELKFPSKPILLIGGIGSGKFTVTQIISQQIGLELVVFRQEQQSLKNTILQFTSTLFSTSKRILYIKEAELLDAKSLQFISEYSSKNPKLNFSIILATSDSSGLKVKSMKRYSNEIKLQQATIEQINIYCDKVFQIYNTRSSNQRLIKSQIQDSFTGDIRQLNFNLEMSLLTSDNVEFTKIQTVLTPQQQIQQTYLFSVNKQKQKLSEVCQNFFIDPQFYHCSSVTNYQDLNNYNVKQTQYFADLFSLADCQIHRMYSQGDWTSAKSCQLLEIGIPASLSQVCPTQAKLKQFGFIKLPYQMLGLKKQCLSVLNKYKAINIEQMLCERQFSKYIESILAIIDGSYFIGMQEGDEDIGLQMTGAQYQDLISIYEQSECIGRTKKELLKWLDKQAGLDIQTEGKKKLK